MRQEGVSDMTEQQAAQLLRLMEALIQELRSIKISISAIRVRM